MFREERMRNAKTFKDKTEFSSITVVQNKVSQFFYRKTFREMQKTFKVAQRSLLPF